MPELLDRALEAHGGAERFRTANEIVADLASGGFAFTMKRQSGALARFEGRVSTSEPRSVLSPFPRPGQRGVMERGAVRIETDEGEVVAERSDPRPAFRRLRRQLRWDDLDLLYFAGYALWNYFTTPLLLTRCEIEERGRTMRVTFPPEIPTHSRRQVFHFDESGLLTRLDYTAEVFGKWARGRHECRNHKSFDGLVFPTSRRVTLGPLPRPTIIWIEVDDVTCLRK